MTVRKLKDNTDIIIKVQKWVQHFVINLNLCPFARRPFENDKVSYKVSDSSSVEDWIKDFIECCNTILVAKIDKVSTSLIIFPSGLESFDFYLDILETCEQMLEDSGLNQNIQLASFHPDYQFRGTEKNDVTNYTNKAPYPIIQLLLVKEVEAAIKAYGSTDEIPKRNQQLMNEIGEKKIKAIMSKLN